MSDAFTTNKQNMFNGLMTTPDPFVAGHAEALGISYASAAKLVAHGMAVMLHGLEQKSKTEQPAADAPTQSN